MLLLGSSAHVHLTPHAVYALPEEGLEAERVDPAAHRGH